MINKKYSKTAVWLLAVFYVVGVVGMSWETSRSLFVSLIPGTLIMSSVVLLLFHSPMQIKQLWLFSVVFIIGLSIEVIGVNTGIPFGQYTYSGLMGIQIFNTPLLIGLNWAMLIYMMWVLTGKLKVNGWLRVTIASTLMVVYDLVLEPFAINFGMWSWEADTPPIQNYLAWFAIAFVLFLLVWKSRLKMANPMALPMYIIHVVFFTILFIIN